MKKITFLFTLLLIISVSFGQNLITNGDFEGLPTGNLTASSTPWSTGQATGTAIQDNAFAHGGTFTVSLGNDFRNLRQTFTAVAGTSYTLKLWNQFLGGQGLPEATDGIFVSIRRNSGVNGTPFDTNIGFYIDPSAGDLLWTEFSLEFTAPETDLFLYVFKQTRAAGGPNNAARMDDFSIVVTPTASLEDLQKFGFSASPNPATDYIKLSASKNISKIEIYNVVGQQVESRVLNSNNNRINVSNLSKGIYFMKAFIEDAVGTYKFVKQ